jgi:hypothetical protein
MSLPLHWVDRIFSKLTVRYGAAFMRTYEGLPLDEVKADWAEELDGFDGESIAYGLRFLPSDRPPNVLQFRDQCRRAPSKQLAIGHDHAPASPEVVAQVRAVFANWRGDPDPKAWATKLQARHQRGERLTPFQVGAYREALDVSRPIVAEEA